MSVSSHLTPDPERRLRVIHGNIYNSIQWTDSKLGAVMLLAAVQLATVKYLSPDGLAAHIASLMLCAVMPPGILGISPFIETPKPIPLLEPGKTQRPKGSLIGEADIAGYSQLELVNFLDSYLGGGITATPYYEDIVVRIVIGARVAARKRRLFAAACVLAGLAQLCLLVQLVFP